jgi:dihydromethanopterin reductase (acceptor)
MEKVAAEHEVSCFLSSAGELVVRVYGLWPKLGEICPGSRYRELVREKTTGSCSPFTGRFTTGTYNALIISPASANTVAKVVHGISDTLVTNAVAQAEKGGVPVIFVPTDSEAGETKTKLPYFVDRSICATCQECVVIPLCPHGAMSICDELPRIDLSKCEGCGICLAKCPKEAVSFGKEITVRIRKVDAENVRELRENPNFIVLSKPEELLPALEKLISGIDG